MNYEKTKKIIRVLFIIVGGTAIISETFFEDKNYYIQSIGIVLLMMGLFMVTTTVKSKKNIESDPSLEEEE
ncbi:hypothetical protein [Aquimarina muelleri]|uniref:Uncharacterized protein n=1 Tax=Aquimarina muelleri TaxID=279356 RepID=A0A918JYT2_9FLAO|nr:hypothetical protein [Aquimarina muelleri]MCX2764466.1 hypothetical protein [Aquimarina muelleri]GGX32681.1 hypothetical protein GCM10007384_36850 [Aquimarina muelleri]